MTIPAFLLAIAILIAVHEYGHYRMAVACGVKVLRFSIGFGKPLLRWRAKSSGTEFVIALLPLGGFVKMLDEREGEVLPQQRQLAFNTQSLWRRSAIVLAGPLANLLLAVLLYALVNWLGLSLPQAILSPPPVPSLASQAGIQGGERVLKMGLAGAELANVASFEDLRWALTEAVVNGQDLDLLLDGGPQQPRQLRLALSTLDGRQQLDAGMFKKIGIVVPLSQPVIGEMQADGAAAQAGLQVGDEVQQIDGQPVLDGQHLRQLIRTSPRNGQVQPQHWQVLRGQQLLDIVVRPKVVLDNGESIGLIGALVGARPAMVTVSYGPLDGLWRGAVKTWQVSILTLKMMGKMLLGQASLKNISGPLTIADYAGKSANVGAIQYLLFLALISVSLGVLNLLPLPVLDGGHLVYYLWEGITGKPVSEHWFQRLQNTGVAILVLMMSVALFNDVSRLIG